MKVISVEDSLINQTLLTERLKLRDYEVVQAGDGIQAIELLNAEEDIDLALLDIGLPYKSGLEVAQFIRETEHLRHIPIIILTGHATAEYKAEAERIGVDAFFSKPLDFKALFKKIAELQVTA